jgi:hypothetical protein
MMIIVVGYPSLMGGIFQKTIVLFGLQFISFSQDLLEEHINGQMFFGGFRLSLPFTLDGS